MRLLLQSLTSRHDVLSVYAKNNIPASITRNVLQTTFEVELLATGPAALVVAEHSNSQKDIVPDQAPPKKTPALPEGECAASTKITPSVSMSPSSRVAYATPADLVLEMGVRCLTKSSFGLVTVVMS
mmetsp:Transcript_54241/g.176225  ORF Transcript_54241/g.176225 Transcript_54241/m.176225 type:complete len:127 (-) Transcript_54241:1799-2179(-)